MPFAGASPQPPEHVPSALYVGSPKPGSFAPADCQLLLSRMRYWMCAASAVPVSQSNDVPLWLPAGKFTRRNWLPASVTIVVCQGIVVSPQAFHQPLALNDSTMWLSNVVVGAAGVGGVVVARAAVTPNTSESTIAAVTSVRARRSPPCANDVNDGIEKT